MIQILGTAEQVVDAEVARREGFTVVDLSDGWAPAIFQDAIAADGNLLVNTYRQVFVGLSNDQTDGDGEPLPPGAKNYLELYGIPPSLSVLRQRFLGDAQRDCSAVDTAKLLAPSWIETWGASTEAKMLAAREAQARSLEEARANAGLATLEELGQTDEKLAKQVEATLRFRAERAAFAEMEKRLACEGLMDPAKHKPGSYDMAMRSALVQFQEKHFVMGQGVITRGTLEAAARPLQENNLLSLRRVLAERVTHAAGFLEDGSVRPAGRDGQPGRGPTYRNRRGETLAVPDLVGQSTDAALAALGVRSAEDALAFFRRHAARDFGALRVVVKLPEPPDYYGPHMDLAAEIDRGDVWYELPFDAKGKRLPQARNRYPTLTLFVRWQGQRIPLVRWRTTIGGWRSELASDGEEYFRYKGSDVGPRVWRHVIAAPVWIPPPTTPLGGMVKTKWVGKTTTRVVNYDEAGPGYLSAYGLVAGVHVQETRHADGRVTYFDNGIRVHGSFDYMSLRGRFSHGCHRLYNNLAVRLFSFVLAHRQHRILGQVKLDFRRAFLWKNEVFEMRVPTRGFYYELTPPLPIETLEGNIKGALKQPIVEYVRKPGVVYTSAVLPPAPGGPESKVGGGARESEAGEP